MKSLKPVRSCLKIAATKLPDQEVAVKKQMSCSSSQLLLITEVGEGALPLGTHPAAAQDSSILRNQWTLSTPFQECCQESQRDRQMEGNGQRTLPKITVYLTELLQEESGTLSPLARHQKGQPSNSNRGILRGETLTKFPYLRLTLFFFLIYVYCYFVCMYVCVTVSDSLEQEFQTVVSQHLGVGN